MPRHAAGLLVEKSRADGERSYGTPVAEPADWDNHVLQERAFLDAEETRLLYVAATRARDLLVVGRHVRDAKGAWAKLSPFLTQGTGAAGPEEGQRSEAAKGRRVSQDAPGGRVCAACRAHASMHAPRGR